MSEPARRLREKPPPAPRVQPCASEVPLDRSVFWERHGNSKSRTREFAQSSTLAALKLAALNIDCTELAALRTGQKDASFPSQKPRLGVKPLREASDTLLDEHYQVKEIGCYSVRLLASPGWAYGMTTSPISMPSFFIEAAPAATAVLTAPTSPVSTTRPLPPG